jgi:thymidylate kinase
MRLRSPERAPKCEGRNTAPPACSIAEFLNCLFRSLDKYCVRYCVLHSWESLPEALDSDLDLAVHPEDAGTVPLALRELQQHGYAAVQLLEYAVAGTRYDFAWWDGLSTTFVGVDIIAEYREGGLIFASGEELVASRQKYRNLWVAAPAVEFIYLLAKTVQKGNLSQTRSQRLSSLAGKLGGSVAQSCAGTLFGERNKERVVAACRQETLAELLPELRKSVWWTVLTRDPSNPLRRFVGDAWRFAKRWFRPAGLLVVVLGPDGVGKSTVTTELMSSLKSPFGRQRVFHWRPMVIAPRRRSAADVAQPHGRKPHPHWLSSARVFLHLVDYWVGYALVIRPLLVRSYLVIFDRYCYDMIVDPERYQYGGPSVLPRILAALAPAPDLILFLDAPESMILERKQEVEPQRLRSLRAAYLREARKYARAAVVNSGQPLPQVIAQANAAVIGYLASRLERRYRCRFGVQTTFSKDVLPTSETPS